MSALSSSPNTSAAAAEGLTPSPGLLRAPSKQDIAQLPPFDPLPLHCILVPSTDAEFEAALAELAAAGVVGFDTESKPVFIKNEENTGPHVFQFSTLTRAFIFQLNKPACLPYLKSVLQSQAIVKVGFGLNSDRKLIHSKLGVQLEATVDVDSLFKRLGYRGATGVRSAIAIVFKQQFHKSKKISTSNWGASQLTPAQLGYAGNDAYAALRVWHGCIKPQDL